MPARGSELIRVGHKGADAIVPGNTVASFKAAVDVGVDVVELDVLRPRSDFLGDADWRTAPAGPVADIRGAEPAPLVIAHDWGDAEGRDPMTLDEGLAAFTRSPLDRVEIDLDLKTAGREDEVVDALRRHGLVGRALISTMEIRSLVLLRSLEPDLRLGWTYPHVTRPWDRTRWARPLVAGAGAAMRRRLPQLATRRIPEIGARLMWVYHPLVTARLVTALGAAGVKLIAWTVDDPARMRDLVDLGVDGICTNDPRLFDSL